MRVTGALVAQRVVLVDKYYLVSQSVSWLSRHHAPRSYLVAGMSINVPTHSPTVMGVGRDPYQAPKRNDAMGWYGAITRPVRAWRRR